MQESYFGLRKRPFLAVPSLERYCPTATHEAAYSTAVRVIQREEGPIAIIGGAGLGKSIICLRLAETFRRSLEVILLTSSQICSRRALLQSILFELKMPYRDLNEGELRLSLLDRLQSPEASAESGLLLIVDEAHTLAPKLLEELRLLTNLTRNNVPRVRLVLCGAPRLEDLLSHPQMDSLNQRLAARCYLTPLNAADSISYLTHKIELCGVPIAAVITEEAIRLVHRASDGIPRLIDQTVDAAMRIAAELRQRPITSAIVENAWAQSQQLPLPWGDRDAAQISDQPSVEFGLLEDEPETDFLATDRAYVYRENESSSLATNDTEPYSSEAVTKTPLQSVPRFPANKPEKIASIQSVSRASSNATPVSSLPTPSAGGGLSRSIAGPTIAGAVTTQSLSLQPSTHYVYDANVGEAIESDKSVHSNVTSLPAGSPYLHSLLDNSTSSDAQRSNNIQRETGESIFGSDFDEEVVLQSNRLQTKSYTEDWVDISNDSIVKGRHATENGTDAPQHSKALSEAFDDLKSKETLQEYSGTSSNFASTPVDVVDDSKVDSSLYAFRDQPNYTAAEIEKERALAAQEILAQEALIDQISFTNLEAMTFATNELQRPTKTDVRKLDHDANPKPIASHVSAARRSAIFSFSDLVDLKSSDDDRDLLMIEQEVTQLKAGFARESNELPKSGSSSPSTVSVHPYKQLFSKLRG